jgi:hypothetical protein
MILLRYPVIIPCTIKPFGPQLITVFSANLFQPSFLHKVKNIGNTILSTVAHKQETGFLISFALGILQKSKIVPVHEMKVCVESGIRDPLIRNLGVEWK